MRLVDHLAVEGDLGPPDAAPVEVVVGDRRAVLPVGRAHDAARVRRQGVARPVEGVPGAGGPVDAERIGRADRQPVGLDHEDVAAALHRDGVEQPVGIVAVEQPQLHALGVLRPHAQPLAAVDALEPVRTIGILHRRPSDLDALEPARTIESLHHAL